jgi:hypothetical protein
MKQVLLTRRTLLATIFLTALFLRVWGIGFDLPYVSHPDEPHEVHRALRLGAGDFEFERVGKGGYFYLLFVEYGLFFLLLKLWGVVTSVKDFMNYFFHDPTQFWLIGRLTTAVIGTLNIGLVYLLGKRTYGDRVGIVSAVLLTFSSLSVLHAHYVTVDVPMTCAVIITALFALRIYETGDIKYYLLAGFFVALATMTKLAAAPVVLVICLAHLLNCRARKQKLATGLVDGRLVICGVVALSIYVLGNPAMVILIAKTVKGLATPLTSKFSGARGFALTSKNLWAYYGIAMKDSLGWPATILMVVSVAYALTRDRAHDYLLLIFPLSLYIIISLPSASFLRNPRYVLPALPFLCILGARFLVHSLGNTKLSSKWIIGLTITLITFVCTPQLYRIVQQNRAFSRPGSPILAKNWIEANIPDGAKILMEGYPGAPSERRVCPIQDKVENMEMLAEKIEKESPAGAIYVRNKAAMQTGKAYDLMVVKPRSPWMTWDEAKRRSIQYVVISLERFQQPPERHSVQVKETRLDFYKAMLADPEARLLKKFYPKTAYDDHATPRGFHLEIYRISALQQATVKTEDKTEKGTNKHRGSLL